jgi:hypothetical protein
MSDDAQYGARPGNVIGTGNSLPMSGKASNIGPGDTRSSIAPRLPDPAAITDDARAYLDAARRALAAGRSGEAQEALERAETRLLSRDVAAGHTNDAVSSGPVENIRQGLQALAAGDRSQSMSLIDSALAQLGGG